MTIQTTQTSDPHARPLHASDFHRRVADDLRWLGQEPENWVPDTAGTDHDVLIVGGGHSGVAIAWGLRRAGIRGVSVVESHAPANTGAWRTKARMRNLRTAKSALGPELGIPSLTFQAWFEAAHGREAYDALARIPTRAWTEYVTWLKDITAVDVRYNTRVIGIDSSGEHLRVELERDGQRSVETTRKIVLATGIAGSGEPLTPAAVSHLPASLRAHTDSPIDFSRLKGRTVAIIGGASSAFDAASTALEAGAAAVHLFCRAERLSPSSNMSTLSYPGAQENFHSLPDDARWRLAWHFRERSPGPTPEVVARATVHDHFHLHLGCKDLHASAIDGKAAIWAHGTSRTPGMQVTPGPSVLADQVITGTGYRADLSLRPELADVAPHILRWGDLDTIPKTEKDRANALSPYLGAGYEFQSRTPGAAPWLQHIHCFNFAAITSFGRHIGDVGSVKEGVPRLVRHIARDFFLADIDQHLQRLTRPVPDELAYASYAASVVSPTMAPIEQ